MTPEMREVHERVGQRSRQRARYGRSFWQKVMDGENFAGEAGSCLAAKDTEMNSRGATSEILGAGECVETSPSGERLASIQQHELCTPMQAADYIRVVHELCKRKGIRARFSDCDGQVHLLAWATEVDWAFVTTEALTV